MRIIHEANNYRIVELPDETCSLDDLCGDTYKPELHPEIPREKILAELEDFRQLVEREGVYGYVLEKAKLGGWEHVDSCFGFVGQYAPADKSGLFNHYIVDELKAQIPKPRKSKAYPYATLKQFTKSQINGLTKSLALVRFGRGTDNNAWDRLFEKAKSFGLEVDYNNAHIRGEKLTFTKPRKITSEQTELGKQWLRNHFFKANGQPRAGKNTEYVSESVLKIAKSASRFEFVGVLVVASDYGYSPCQVLPVYRTYNRKGESFDYAPIHWGQPVIMEGN